MLQLSSKLLYLAVAHHTSKCVRRAGFGNKAATYERCEKGRLKKV